MFDFRYHALSLAAVFIALAVGLLLGVAIGDAGLVSSGERKLRENLRSDVRAANRRADELRDTLGKEHQQSKRFEEAVYPVLVDGRLRGTRIGLVFLGSPSDDLAGDVRAAVGPGGGQVVLRAVIREPPDLGEIAARARGTRYAAIERDPNLVEPFGFRMGQQLAAGGKLIGQVRSALLTSFNGSLQPLDAVVIARRPRELSGEAAKTRDAFERGFVHGVVASETPAAGAERTPTSPSEVTWYRKNNLSSVDDVDQVAGRTALVFVLGGGVDGAFGVKSTAEALLPDVVNAGR